MSRKRADAPEATPAAVELAEEKGVSVADVEGSGAGGKVTKADVAEVDVPVVTYPLPVPPDMNAPEPQLEEVKQQLSDASKRVEVLEAKLAEVTAE